MTLEEIKQKFENAQLEWNLHEPLRWLINRIEELEAFEAVSVALQRDLAAKDKEIAELKARLTNG